MKTDYQILIISRLRKLREEQNFSQKDVAETLGISNGQMGNIESPPSRNKYTLEQIFILCHTFKIRIEQLFIEEEDFISGQNFIDLLISNIIKYEKGR
jgi:transcriptional regulator with XRE-family HTH domain